jgi:hypothetical protein
MAEVYNYVGIEPFITSLESSLTNESNFQSREKFKANPYGAWAGGTTGWDAVKKLWRNGWPEGLLKMREALGSLEPPPIKDRRRKARWADDGEEFDRDRLFTGHYESAWRQVRRESRIAPRPVRITVDVEAHAGSGADALFWRGACGVLLAESLALAGYATQVLATSGADGMGMASGQYKQFVTVVVKDWTSPTYLPTLIATTGHASFLRVGVFAHNIQKMPGKHTGGMGFSLATDNIGALREIGFTEVNVLTVSVPRRVLSHEAATDWVRKTVIALEEAA